MRHAHATNLPNTSIPLKKLQNRLGHSEIGTTMDVYAKDLNTGLGEDTSYLDEANIKRA